MIKIIPIQQELRQPLPVVYGNVDYTEFKNMLERISEIIDLAGLDFKVMCYAINEAEKAALNEFNDSAEKFPGLKKRSNSNSNYSKKSFEVYDCKGINRFKFS